jgi:hypothetical protein
MQLSEVCLIHTTFRELAVRRKVVQAYIKILDNDKINTGTINQLLPLPLENTGFKLVIIV